MEGSKRPHNGTERSREPRRQREVHQVRQIRKKRPQSDRQLVERPRASKSRTPQHRSVQGTRRKRPEGTHSRGNYPRRPLTSSRWEQEDKHADSFVHKTIKFLFNLIYYLVVLTIIISATLFVVNKDQGKSYFGYRFFQVLTNSMAPQEDSDPGGFYAGDIVILTSVNSTNDIREKDIVTYQVGETGKSVLTHRVVKKMKTLNDEPGDYLVTKGDANNSNDPPIQANRVIGKVVFVIPKVGNFVKIVRANFWPFLIFALSLIGFLLTLKLYLFAPRRR